MIPEVFFPESPKHEWDTHRSVVVPPSIDTGVGNHKERPYIPSWGHLELDFLGNPQRAGVHPDAVDIVINTHLHVDHVGWSTRLEGQTWVPTFRNASYLMPKANFESWNPTNNPKIAGGSGVPVGDLQVLG